SEELRCRGRGHGSRGGDVLSPAPGPGPARDRVRHRLPRVRARARLAAGSGSRAARHPGDARLLADFGPRRHTGRMTKECKLPDLGEGMTEAEIVRVLVNEGDEIKEDQAVLLVETEKAQVELPSPFGGRVAAVHVQAGQRVKVGAVLLSFGDGVGSAPKQSAVPASPARA